MEDAKFILVVATVILVILVIVNLVGFDYAIIRGLYALNQLSH